VKLLIVHGPNLNLLGTREPDTYGHETLDQVNAKIEVHAQSKGVFVSFFQSNHEGDIIDRIQKTLDDNGSDAIVINPGAYTHYSYAIRDAIASVGIPAIEVHLSDINNREDFRKVSVIAPVCREQISGHGVDSYLKAIDLLLDN